MNAESLEYAAGYGLITGVPIAKRAVFKNFMKPNESASRFTLFDIHDVTQKDIVPNMHKLLQILLPFNKLLLQLSKYFHL